MTEAQRYIVDTLRDDGDVRRVEERPDGDVWVFTWDERIVVDRDGECTWHSPDN